MELDFHRHRQKISEAERSLATLVGCEGFKVAVDLLVGQLRPELRQLLGRLYEDPDVLPS